MKKSKSSGLSLINSLFRYAECLYELLFKAGNFAFFPRFNLIRVKTCTAIFTENVLIVKIYIFLKCLWEKQNTGVLCIKGRLNREIMYANCNVQ